MCAVRVGFCQSQIGEPIKLAAVPIYMDHVLKICDFVSGGITRDEWNGHRIIELANLPHTNRAQPIGHGLGIGFRPASTNHFPVRMLPASNQPDSIHAGSLPRRFPPLRRPGPGATCAARIPPRHHHVVARGLLSVRPPAGVTHANPVQRKPSPFRGFARPLLGLVGQAWRRFSDNSRTDTGDPRHPGAIPVPAQRPGHPCPTSSFRVRRGPTGLEPHRDPAAGPGPALTSNSDRTRTKMAGRPPTAAPNYLD
jgi:hypothetical protein